MDIDMEVVIYSCEERNEIERFKLSQYKLDTFLDELECDNQCADCANDIIVELYNAGRLTMSKQASLTTYVQRFISVNKALLA
jgi:hypothetical protein